MVDHKLKELIDYAKSTDIQELSWEKGGVKVSFRRSDVKPAVTKASIQAAAVVAAATKAPEPIFIKSTMVGTFFRSETSNRPPLVVEGTEVSSGQTVASVEAMKIRKDVVSPLNCKIIRPLVTDGHSVEYGQPLFEVELLTESN